MATQTLSFDGLEVEPDVGRPDKSRSKKRRNDASDASSSSSIPLSSAASSASARVGSSEPASKRPKHAASSKKKKQTAEQKAAAKEFAAKLNKYKEVQGPLFGKSAIKATHNSKLRKEMKIADEQRSKHAEAAARAEILLPSSAGAIETHRDTDRTWRLSQEQLKPALDSRTQQKMFELNLDGFGPYSAAYTRNGRHMLLAGKKGHIALMNCQTMSLEGELHVKEQVNDACFLHDETMYAVAQKKHVYIYDRTGMELHALRNHIDPLRLQFLPYHFLLASVGETGYLKYQDTSTGQFLCEWRTKLGRCDVLSQNPSNAVLLLGHTNGCVTMWTPNMPKPVVTVKTHKAPVRAVATDIGGNMMVTTGLDGQVKIWDVRTYRELHSYFTVRPATSVDVSDQGLLALGFGPHVQVWKDAFREKQKAPYMVKQISGQIVRSVAWRPYEDVLGVGHSGGFSSLVIPGAGESNFDSLHANPFQTNKQRREHTVHSLLDKLQPDMITLDQNMFGMMSKASKQMFDGERRAVREQREAAALEESMAKNRARGKSKSSKKLLRKNANIIDQARMERMEKAQQTQQAIVNRKKEAERIAEGKPKSALDRFSKKN